MNILLPTLSFYHWNIMNSDKMILLIPTLKAPPSDENIKKQKSYDLPSKPNQLPSFSNT